jgi:hypothetical protein
VLAGGAMTRDWEALAMTDLIGEGGQITVTGEVELNASGPTAELKEHLPPEPDPRVLALDLVIHRHGGPEGYAGWFERLTFKKKLLDQAYEEVAILYAGQIVQRVKVEHPLTFTVPPPRVEKNTPTKTPAKQPVAKKAAPTTFAKPLANKPARPGAKKPPKTKKPSKTKSQSAPKKTNKKAPVKAAKKASKRKK